MAAALGACAYPQCLYGDDGSHEVTKGGSGSGRDLSGEGTKLFVFTSQQPTEYFDMGIFLAFFVVVSLVCLILLVKIKLKQRRSQVRGAWVWER